MLLNVYTNAPGNKKSGCQNLHRMKEIICVILECTEWFNYEQKWLLFRKNTFFFLATKCCHTWHNEKDKSLLPFLYSSHAWLFWEGEGCFGVFVGITELQKSYFSNAKCQSRCSLILFFRKETMICFLWRRGMLWIPNIVKLHRINAGDKSTNLSEDIIVTIETCLNPDLHNEVKWENFLH